jgi:hypothetical protein
VGRPYVLLLQWALVMMQGVQHLNWRNELWRGCQCVGGPPGTCGDNGVIRSRVGQM